MSMLMNRVAALGGVGYAVLSMVAIFQTPLPDMDNSPDEIRAFLATDPRAGVWAETVLLLFALFGLLLFAARLSIELRARVSGGRFTRPWSSARRWCTGR